jgi:hypothetical protein
MNLERYHYIISNDYQKYVFYSDGPKGRIKKVVTYTKLLDEPVTYNLGFGDESVAGIVDDAVVSNNEDRDMVLATVASTINLFCDYYGNHFIYAEGRTPVRTRLYQMGISRLWEEISRNFQILGFINDDWEDFQNNVNYEAFLVKRL